MYTFVVDFKQIVHKRKTADLDSLHGTFLPPTQIAAQRRLSQPLPVQPTLQDKLHRSRIQHFVSLLFDRPSARDMSRIERWLLAVMWPAAVGALCLAMVEVLGDLKWRDDWRHGSLLASGHIDRADPALQGEGSGITHSVAGVRWGPQLMGIMAALLTCLVRSGVISTGWRRVVSSAPVETSGRESSEELTELADDSSSEAMVDEEI